MAPLAPLATPMSVLLSLLHAYGKTHADITTEMMVKKSILCVLMCFKCLRHIKAFTL